MLKQLNENNNRLFDQKKTPLIIASPPKSRTATPTVPNVTVASFVSLLSSSVRCSPVKALAQSQAVSQTVVVSQHPRPVSSEPVALSGVNGDKSGRTHQLDHAYSVQPVSGSRDPVRSSGGDGSSSAVASAEETTVAASMESSKGGLSASSSVSSR